MLWCFLYHDYPATFEPLHTRSTTPSRLPQTLPVRPAVPEDSINVSAAGQQRARETAGDQATTQGEAPGGAAGLPTPGTAPELDATAQRVLQSLRQRDQEVRLHEQAHLLAAGPHASGGPSYTYQTGPDGKRYAVGGEVPIDLSAVPGDPQATLQKALTIRRAALAPTHPSGADQAVAAKATSLAAQAQQELLQAQSAGPLATQRAAAAQAETSGGTADRGDVRATGDIRARGRRSRHRPRVMFVALTVKIMALVPLLGPIYRCLLIPSQSSREPCKAIR